jgi:single-strand DNA-binding protein
MNSIAPNQTRKHRNEVIVAGIVAREPIIRVTTTGKRVGNFSLCTALTAKTREFHRITAWENLADALDGLNKGVYAEVHGRLQSRSWDDADGAKHVVVEIVANKIIIPDTDGRTSVEATDGLF